jgi:hypothetical protein
MHICVEYPTREKKRIILTLKLSPYKISTLSLHIIYITVFFTCYLYVKLLQVNCIFENFMVKQIFWFSKNLRSTCKYL